MWIRVSYPYQTQNHTITKQEERNGKSLKTRGFHHHHLCYITKLGNYFIHLEEEETDKLIWTKNGKDGSFSTKMGMTLRWKGKKMAQSSGGGRRYGKSQDQ